MTIDKKTQAICTAREKIADVIRCLTVLKADLAAEALRRLERDHDMRGDCLDLLDSLKGREQELYGYRRAVVDLVEGSRGLEIARQITGALNAIDQMRREICS